jgi:hypothetical protein
VVAGNSFLSARYLCVKVLNDCSHSFAGSTRALLKGLLPKWNDGTDRRLPA